MRRDYFELDVTDVDWYGKEESPRQPTVSIDFYGPPELLRERFTAPTGELLDASELDVALRLQGPIDDSETSGVVSVTDRLTGDYVLELNADADDVLHFIGAAREYGRSTDTDDGLYRVEIAIEDEHLVTLHKSTFLVYDVDGELLRGQSLIPSGVEL